ncbi:hypothetical protein ZWY2020_042703 [Hordeum vulgare]|nr:hypothetical protein ZWY2020_042703 [Hordeum vulgare]
MSIPSSSDPLLDPIHICTLEIRIRGQTVDMESLDYPWKPRYTTKQALRIAAMEEQFVALIQPVNDSRAANGGKLEAIQVSLELWRPAVTNFQH